MTGKTKIGLIVLLLVVVIASVLVGMSKSLLTNIVKTEIDKQLAELQDYKITYDDVRLNLATRSVTVEGVHAISLAHDTLPADTCGIDLRVAELKIEHIGIRQFLKNNRVAVKNIAIDGLDVNLQIGAEKSLTETDTVQVKKETSAQKLFAAGTNRFELRNARLRVKNVSNNMSARVENLNLTLHDICYHFDDKQLSYNDSLYELDLSGIGLTNFDGIYNIDIQKVATENSGAIYANDVHVWSPIPKTKLAELKGNIPTTWVETRIDSLRTTPLNLFAQAIDKQIVVDSVFIVAKQFNLYRDSRFDAKEPYQMPQQKILKMPLPVEIHHIDVRVPRCDIEMATTDKNCGQMALYHTHVTIDDFSNRHDETIKMRMLCRLHGGGFVDVSLNLTLDKHSHLYCLFKVADGTGEALNSFVRPLFGVTFDCNIDKITAEFVGDEHQTEGIFTMLYRNLVLHVHGNESPYVFIAKNGGLINFLSQLVLPKSNPSKPNGEFRSYKISYERDEYQVFPAYLIHTLVNGVKETLFPGFYVKKRVKSKK